MYNHKVSSFQDDDSSSQQLDSRGSVADSDDLDNVTSSSADYVPLLSNWRQLLPGYRLRRRRGGAASKTQPEVSVAEKKKTGRRAKSPSPAGVRSTAGEGSRPGGKTGGSRERSSLNLNGPNSQKSAIANKKQEK